MKEGICMTCSSSILKWQSTQITFVHACTLPHMVPHMGHTSYRYRESHNMSYPLGLMHQPTLDSHAGVDLYTPQIWKHQFNVTFSGKHLLFIMCNTCGLHFNGDRGLFVDSGKYDALFGILPTFSEVCPPIDQNNFVIMIHLVSQTWTTR